MSALVRSKLPVKLLKGLFWAEWHMKEARALCVHVVSLGEVSDELHHALFTGIVVSYARPFRENQGLAALGAKFRKFPTKAALVLHEGILEARDLRYAHNDRVTIPTRLSADVDQSVLDNVGIRILPSGRASWNVARAGFSSEQAHDIGALCEYQITRIHNESATMLQAFSKHRAYEPGIYTLGVDFP